MGSEMCIRDSKYPEEAWFPESADEATEVILGLTSSVAEGGIDATGPTDWAAVIGQDNSNVNCNSAATFTSGGTLSTYLAFQNCEGAAEDRCAPLTAIIITDGEADEASQPDIVKVHKSFAGLRNGRNVKTYVVGFVADGKLNPFGRETVNDFACAATGAGDVGGDPNDPCNAGSLTHGFDTCKDPNDPNNECAFMLSLIHI